MPRRIITGARDTGKQGMKIRDLLDSFNLIRDAALVNDLIRSGNVELNGERIKDVLFVAQPGTYIIKIRGDAVAEVTIL